MTNREICGLVGVVRLVPAVLAPYRSSEWLFRQVTRGALVGFQQGDEPPGFATGDAAFGLGGFCPLDGTIRTGWALNTDLLLRRNIVSPVGVAELEIGVAIDNDVQVWFNGVEISGGVRRSEGCAVFGPIRFHRADSIVLSGDNLLAVRAIDRGGLSYVDVRVNIRAQP